MKRWEIPLQQAMHSVNSAGLQVSFPVGFGRNRLHSARCIERKPLQGLPEGPSRRRHFLLLSMAVPVGAAVALTRNVDYGEDDPQNGREVYSDENVVENHIDRLSVTVF